MSPLEALPIFNLQTGGSCVLCVTVIVRVSPFVLPFQNVLQVFGSIRTLTLSLSSLSIEGAGIKPLRAKHTLRTPLRPGQKVTNGREYGDF